MLDPAERYRLAQLEIKTKTLNFMVWCNTLTLLIISIHHLFLE